MFDYDALLRRTYRLPVVRLVIYDLYRKFLLMNLVEVYFELREEEVEPFRQALSRP